jgi:hypothetical protein
MIVELGFIYGLRNPLTGEIFYIGSTECSLKNRLRTHYQHLREFERGLRKENRRYLYLQNLRPIKAEIFLLEIVTNDDIEQREKFYIKKFRGINPNLTNMTDGGRGAHTSKYYTEKEMEIYSSKISKSNKGRPKPPGFAENLSINRRGLNNPAAKPLRIGVLVCFKDNEPVRMFKYGFEINEFVNSNSGLSAVLSCINNKPFKPYGYTWKKFSECTQEVQDIVQSLYENLG